MPNCEKLARKLRPGKGEYDFRDVRKFLEECCGLFFRPGGKGSHFVFYLNEDDPDNVNSQITIPVHGGKVKKWYIEKMWAFLRSNGIEWRENG